MASGRHAMVSGHRCGLHHDGGKDMPMLYATSVFKWIISSLCVISGTFHHYIEVEAVILY